MDSITLIASVSMITATSSTCLGCVIPALAEGRAIVTGLTAISQQPDAAATITRALFVGLAMIESIAIYCFVVSMILIFANPFWTYFVSKAQGG
jgi:F-type H+-transporting ATPase subunit c